MAWDEGPFAEDNTCDQRCSQYDIQLVNETKADCGEYKDDNNCFFHYRFEKINDGNETILVQKNKRECPLPPFLPQNIVLFVCSVRQTLRWRWKNIVYFDWIHICLRMCHRDHQTNPNPGHRPWYYWRSYLIGSRFAGVMETLDHSLRKFPFPKSWSSLFFFLASRGNLSIFHHLLKFWNFILTLFVFNPFRADVKYTWHCGNFPQSRLSNKFDIQDIGRK